MSIISTTRRNHAPSSADPQMDVVARDTLPNVQESESNHMRDTTSMGDRIVWTANPDGDIEWVNGRGYDYTGRREEGGWPRESIIHPDDLELVTQAWEAAKRTGIYETELRLRRHDGEFRWFSSRAWPLRDHEGKITHWFGTAIDIQNQKTTELALQKSQQSIRRELESGRFRQDKLENIDLFHVIDIPALQSFLDDLNEMTHFPVSILDLEANILVGVNWQDICTKWHRAYPETCAHCVESDLRLSAGVPVGEFKVYRCKNNMWELVTPLVVGDQHIGNIMSGQFFFEDDEPDPNVFRAQAHLYGFDETEYMAAFESVPRLSRQSVERGMSLLTKLGYLISQLIYYRVKAEHAQSAREGEE